MSIPGYRRFQFFNKYSKDISAILKDDSYLTCMTGGNGSLYFGDSKGCIHTAPRADRDLKFTTFRAHDRPITHILVAKSCPHLLTVSDNAEIKCWQLDKLSPDDGVTPNLLFFEDISKLIQTPTPPGPVSSRTLGEARYHTDEMGETHFPNQPSESAQGMMVSLLITCIACTERHTNTAVGLSTGDTILFGSDMARRRVIIPANHYDHNPSGAAFAGGDMSVKGLIFVTETDGSVGLFVVTPRSIRIAVLGGPRLEIYLVEPTGPRYPGCCSLTFGHRELLVATPTDGVRGFLTSLADREFSAANTYFYQDDMRAIAWFRTSYLFVVGYASKPAPGDESGGPLSAAPPTPLAPSPATTASSATPFSGTAASAPGGPDDRNYYVRVYDPKNKVVALQENGLPELHSLTAEWGAVFALSRSGRELYQFEEKDGQTKLDMLFRKNLYDVAINVARNMDYGEDQIADIYRRYGDHLCDDKRDYMRAVEQYIRTIGTLEPSYVIRRFLEAPLIDHLTKYLQELHVKGVASPDHTTLLINCYTKQKNEAALDKFISEQSLTSFDVDTAIRVCQQAGYHDLALKLSQRAQKHEITLRVLIELGRLDAALAFIQTLPPEKAAAAMKESGKFLLERLPEPTVRILVGLCAKSKPDDYVHLFVDKPAELIAFLEAVTQANAAQSAFIYDTLLELYLKDDDLKRAGLTGDELEAKIHERRAKALRLLHDQSAAIEKNHALVLCQEHRFRDGVLFLLQLQGLYAEMLQYVLEEARLSEEERYHEILALCQQFGVPTKGTPGDARLWSLALSFFASKKKPYDANLRDEAIREILAHIREIPDMHPLPALQILSSNPEITLGVAKDYIKLTLDARSQAIRQDTERIEQKKAQIEVKRRNIEELRTSAKIFQPNQCAQCRQRLDLPAVHFMCGDSFHAQCLANDKECPICTPEFQKIRERQRVQQANRTGESHDAFMREVDVQGFALVAEYFGKGVFQKGVVVESKKAQPFDKLF